MILIAHRGNTNGPNPDKENRPEYLWYAIGRGYEVEADVWYDGGWWLGHGKPRYKCSYNHDLTHFWCHCKNREALERLSSRIIFNCFWHQDDDYTITSRNNIICHSGLTLLKNSVCMLPELGYEGDLKKCYAICSNFIGKYDKAGNIRR